MFQVSLSRSRDRQEAPRSKLLQYQLIFYHTVTKGTSSQLLKMSAKRHRSKQQIALDKLEEETRVQQIEEKTLLLQQKEAELQRLREKNEELKVTVKNAEEFRDDLVENAVLKIGEDGRFISVEDPTERTLIREEKASKKKTLPQLLGALDGDQLEAQSQRDFKSAVDDEEDSHMEEDLSGAD